MSPSALPASVHRRNLFAVSAACFIGFAGFTLVMPFLPLYFAELGIRDVSDLAFWSGISLGVTPAITALLSPLWGRVADRFGRKLMLQRSPQAYAAAKRLLWLAGNVDLESGMVAESLAQSALIGTPEHKEAVWRRSSS